MLICKTEMFIHSIHLYLLLFITFTLIFADITNNIHQQENKTEDQIGKF